MPRLKQSKTYVEKSLTCQLYRTWRKTINNYFGSFLPNLNNKFLLNKLTITQHEDYGKLCARHYIRWKTKKQHYYIKKLQNCKPLRKSRFLLFCHFNNYNKLTHLLINFYWFSLYPTRQSTPKFFKRAQFFKYYGLDLPSKVKSIFSTNQLVFIFDRISYVWKFIFELDKLQLKTLIYPLCIADLYGHRFVPLVYFNIDQLRELSQKGYKRFYFHILLKRIILNYKQLPQLWMDEIFTTPFF